MLPTKKRSNLRDVSLRAYTEHATAVFPRSQCQLFQVKGCRVVNVAEPLDRNLGFIDWSSYFFYQVPPQLYSRDWIGQCQAHYSENAEALDIEPGPKDQ
jgi:hypothetical protein